MSSSDHTAILRSLVDQYRLEVQGVQFWAPYWVNNPKLMADPHAPKVKGAFKGKGTPGQLALGVRRMLARNTVQSPRSADDYRQLMRRHGLGIDCSGFAYYVLSGWLRAASYRPLAQQLIVSRDAVLNAMRGQASWRRRQVAESEVRQWPQQVTLEQVCRRFHKDPRMLTAAATLVHPNVVTGVGRVEDALPGDLIKFTSPKWGDHIAIVVGNKGANLVIAESIEPEDQLGGVGYTQVPVPNPQQGLEYQGWSRTQDYHPGGASRDGIWRLKEVAT